jgi:hypothetical protein
MGRFPHDERTSRSIADCDYRHEELAVDLSGLISQPLVNIGRRFAHDPDQ